MVIRSKLVILELAAGLFGWGWIVASLASIYFFVAAAAFEGKWSSFVVALVLAGFCKWLARGFHDNEVRVGYEEELMNWGFSRDEAFDAWLTAYSGGPDRLADLKKAKPNDKPGPADGDIP
jgi:hypothetical protein